MHWSRPSRVVVVCLTALAAALSALVLASPATGLGAAGRAVSSSASASVSAALRLPGGFTDTVVAGVAMPTAMAWTPDGDMLVTTKAGRLVGVAEGQPNEVLLDITGRVCSDKELGLLGLAVDPEFETNRYVYLYYSQRRGDSCGEDGGRQPVNRVGRFVLPASGPILPSSQVVIVDNIVSAEAHHVAGDLEFGENGYLYISVGDGVCTVRGTRKCGATNTNSQDRAVPHGKILRVTRDGLPPATNPYAGAQGARRCTNPAGVPAGTGPCKEIWALGLRNPFRFARMPGTDKFFVNDVGLHTWEEVNLLAKGANYGWNAREGSCVRGSTTNCGEVAPYTNPIHSYQHTTECRSITGGAFVPAGLWPGFDGAYLYADYACGKMWRLDPLDGGGYQRTLFTSGLDGPVHLRFGPHDGRQALYYLSIFTDTVHRVTDTSENSPPTAAFGYVPDGNTVTFSGAASSDGDQGDQVEQWRWDFGDGSEESVTSGPDVVHTYAAPGEYQVSLTVTDTRGGTSAPTVKTVHAGEHPPTVSITAPSVDARFSVGQPFVVTADATDQEDGSLPGSSISWTILRQHANHVHPFLGPQTGFSVNGTYPDPEDLEAAADSRLVAHVTATDSNGHSTTVSQALRPRKVRLDFATLPAGGVVRIAGDRRRTPVEVVSWAGHVFPVGVPDQRLDGRTYTFKSWSDGGARSHDIVTPSAPATYTATLRRP
jgi:glucose/arabinose dehydrogenase